MKILFIGNSRLGDAILSTSILNYYSGSNFSITVVCSPLTENIYKNFSNVKNIIAVNKKKRGMHWLEAYSLLERVYWDLVIDLRNSILSRLIRKRNILRIGKVNPYKHRVESLCKLINTNEVISPSIPDSNTAKKEALRIISEKNLVQPILAIAPITNWHRKNWPLDNFVLLINSLIKNNMNDYLQEISNNKAKITLMEDGLASESLKTIPSHISTFDLRENMNFFDIGLRSLITLSDLIDKNEVFEINSSEFEPVIDSCTLCDNCNSTCPYSYPHEVNLDFPRMVLEYRAMQRSDSNPI